MAISGSANMFNLAPTQRRLAGIGYPDISRMGGFREYAEVPSVSGAPSATSHSPLRAYTLPILVVQSGLYYYLPRLLLQNLIHLVNYTHAIGCRMVPTIQLETPTSQCKPSKPTEPGPTLYWDSIYLHPPQSLRVVGSN